MVTELENESQNPRMLWVGRNLEDHLFPTPCHGQEYFPLDQDAPGPIQVANWSLELCDKGK